MVLHNCNSKTWEAEAGGFWVWGQLVLESKTLGDKNEEKQKTTLADLKYDGGNINLKSKEPFF